MTMKAFTVEGGAFRMGGGEEALLTKEQYERRQTVVELVEKTRDGYLVRAKDAYTVAFKPGEVVRLKGASKAYAHVLKEVKPDGAKETPKDK